MTVVYIFYFVYRVVRTEHFHQQIKHKTKLMQYRRIPLINPGLIQLRKGFLSGSITGWAYNRGAGLLTEIE